MSSVQYYRLRIPNRQVARFIVGLPNLQFLDLSTCNISEVDVSLLLVRMRGLLHLVLDGCGLLRGELLEGGWAAFGKTCALAGVRRATARERAIKEWMETLAIASMGGQQLVENQPAALPRVKKGRRGLATATISIRKPLTENRPTTFSSSSKGRAVQRIRVLPASPSLLSLAIRPSASVSPDYYAEIISEFELGWMDGISQISATRARLRSSFKNGVRVVRFADDGDDGDKGLDGLEDVDTALFASEQEDLMHASVPKLCLAGPGRNADHVPGCAHSIGMQIWRDEL